MPGFLKLARAFCPEFWSNNRQGHQGERHGGTISTAISLARTTG
ncbi:MAG: hypothetical protein V1724_08800 [Chloroflexota bacterium]